MKIKEEIESIGSECVFVKADLSLEKDCRNIVNLTDKNSIIGDFQDLDHIDGLAISSICANLYNRNRDDFWVI